jgi:hypothetical protein
MECPHINKRVFIQLELEFNLQKRRGENLTQWPKEKVQKDKQRSTKHTHKAKGRVTRTSLKTGGDFRCSGRVSSSCSTSATLCFTLLLRLSDKKSLYYTELLIRCHIYDLILSYYMFSLLFNFDLT